MFSTNMLGLIKLLKNKKTKTVLHAFIEIVDESNGKPNKLWVDQEKGFYNSPIQKWLGDNNYFNVLNT